MIQKISAITFAFLIIIGCKSNSPKPKRNNEITKVDFATGGCLGECPIFSMEADSGLTYKYYGRRYTEDTGYFIGHITQELWDSLNIKLEAINYKQLPTMPGFAFDDWSVEAFIYFNNERKHIHGTWSHFPDSVQQVFDWLVNSYKQAKLSPSDSLSFETTEQNPYDLIPPPPRLVESPETLKFIPPNSK
jgi:hypothetical protein